MKNSSVVILICTLVAAAFVSSPGGAWAQPVPVAPAHPASTDASVAPSPAPATTSEQSRSVPANPSAARGEGAPNSARTDPWSGSNGDIAVAVVIGVVILGVLAFAFSGTTDYPAGPTTPRSA